MRRPSVHKTYSTERSDVGEKSEFLDVTLYESKAKGGSRSSPFDK